MSTILIRKLTEGKEFNIKIVELKENQDNFPSKATGGTKYCHFIKASYDDFPEPVDFQWCKDQDTVTEFKVGDTIKIKAGAYVSSKNRQSITFISKAPPIGLKEKLEEEIKQVVNPNKQIDKHRECLSESDPQVMGRLWSISMGHAIQYYKDRKDATEEKVLAFADELRLHYQQSTL